MARNEVWVVNSYALFMGDLLMVDRGLGLLVFTWSTVVLLGGFVSDLKKKDFWSLAIITLVLTPRVSADVGLSGSLTYIGYSIIGLGRAIFATVNPNERNDHWLRRLLAVVVWLFHLLVGPIVVYPLAALYMCGPLFSTGISAWRLIEHDYVVPKKEEPTHLQPALIVLYSLAMLHGLLVCFRIYSSFAQDNLVNEVVQAYKMDNIKEAVKEYLYDTCVKDIAFIKETNLATYAVGRIKSESCKSLLSGARILDALFEHALRVTPKDHTPTAELTSLVASSSHVLEKLLQALDSTSPYGETIRVVAANIVTHLASRIPLMQFPQGIQRIGSLIDISQKLLEEDGAPSLSTDDYKKLMENGFDILQKLAADEDNCRAISNIEGLLSKVMAPVKSNLLHLIDHDAWWSTIIALSLQVMCRLVSATGETGTKLRCQISSNKEAIHNMVEILKCRECGDKLHILTMEILTQLPMDEGSSSGVNKEMRGNFIKMLPVIFIDTNTSSHKEIRKLAGEALVKLSKSERNAAIILKANDNVVRGLRNIILEDNNTNRIIAAKIFKHLYIHYNENDDYLETLKETIEEVMEKVLPDILRPFGLKGRQTQAEHGTDKLATDIEAPEEGAPQDDGHNYNTPTHQQNEPRKLQAALLSLLAAIFEKLIGQDHDLAQLVRKISPADSATSFANKLKEMVLVPTNSQPTASCLRIMRSTSKMVISMMKHNDNDLKVDLVSFQDFIRSLSTACNRMSCLEGSLILYNTNRGAMKRYMTLASLVKNAQELLDQKE